MNLKRELNRPAKLELNRLIAEAETRTMDARKALSMAVEAVFQLEQALYKLRNEVDKP